MVEVGLRVKYYLYAKYMWGSLEGLVTHKANKSNALAN